MEDRKRLGTLKPTASANTALYTTPASKQTVVSRLFVCNQGAAVDLIRIATSTSAGINASEWLYYDFSLAVGASLTLDSFTIRDTDTILVYSKNGTSSFNAYGIEVS